MQTATNGFDAQSLKEKFLKSHLAGEANVIAILPNGDWFHVSDDQQIPENCMIALQPKNWERVLRE